MKMSSKQWRKILYEDQGYPDNYTDKNTFLQGLRTNTNIKYVKLSEALSGALYLLEEFCTIIAFILVYIYLFNELIEPDVILKCSIVSTIFGYILYCIFYARCIRIKLGHDLRTLLIFTVFGHLFSPILYTLTDTISTDTIYTTTFFMILIHLIFFDYGISAAIVSNSLSLSAIIFASICLSSRLQSAYHAFILITVAIEIFVLFPLLRNRLKTPVVIAPILLILDAYFLSTISNLFTIIFLTTVVIINVICPILFVSYQKHKVNIYGPWDEAIVDDADTVFNLN